MQTSVFRNVDIYLLDQILKERYRPGQLILDAGCGVGRNLSWFYASGFEIYGTDNSHEAIQYCQDLYPEYAHHFQVAAVENLPFTSSIFDHIICSAVLHFARNEIHFFRMFQEMLRVLKPGGSLFIRMASSLATTTPFIPKENGIYTLRDESERFLLTPELLSTIHQSDVVRIEPVKTTNVEELRSMTTLVYQKTD